MSISTESTPAMSNQAKPCPLCSLPQSEILAELGRWRLVRTKTMKGHRERLMLLYREHAKTIDEQSIALRDAMRVLFPEAVALVSAARQGFMREG